MSGRILRYIVVATLIAASLAAFGRIAGNDFVNFDDPRLITENRHVQNGINTESVKWALTDSRTEYWNPLTWLLIMLDWRLFGANASGHHLVSLFFHIGAMLFLFLFLNKATKSLWPSAFAAAIFALHPLRVESVAWASELKDVLSMFFGMATLYAYAFYAEGSKYSRYFICLILFALSLMSKPMLVTLPFVLLLLDYWPLGRWQEAFNGTGFQSVRGLILEKVPFFCLAVGSSVVTLFAQNQAFAVLNIESLPLYKRIANMIVSYVAYLGKIFWPVDLAVLYPYDFSLPVWKVIVSGIILMSITLAVIYYIRKLPFLFVGWFWYLGTLLPVSGLVQVGAQAMADRYTYLPSVGIAIIFSYSVASMVTHKSVRKEVVYFVAAIVLTAMIILTWIQCGYWKNSTVLFQHTLRLTKNNHIVHNNLGTTLLRQGKLEESIKHTSEAIRLKPNYEVAYFNRGTAYAGIGQLNHALKDFNETLRLNPRHVEALNSRGVVHARRGQYQTAIKDFNMAIDLTNDYSDAYNNRAIVQINYGNRFFGCNDAKKACDLGKCAVLEDSKRKGTCP